MAANSIASELLGSLDINPYKNDIDDYGLDNFLDPEDIKRLRTKIRDRFWIDTRPFQTRRGNIIPTGVYSIFGKYNNTPPETVKTELADWVDERRDEYTLLLGNILSAKKWSFGTWSINLKLKSKPADAGAMYCISRMYHRHTIVYHKYGFWSTVADNKSRPETSKMCDVHLILLGELKYGEIRPILLNNDNPDTADWDKFEQWFQKACRDNTPSATIPPNVRQKRVTASINYYDMNCGKAQYGAKSSKQNKGRVREPTTLSEPSAERVAAQRRIQLEKQRQKQKQNKIESDLSVICELPPDIDDNDAVPEMKTEIKLEIKQEDDQRNTRHKYKGKDLDWLKVRYIHKDGSICNKERRLQEETIRDLESQLPDLPDSLRDETTDNRSTNHHPQLLDQTDPNGTNQVGLPVETNTTATTNPTPASTSSNDHSVAATTVAKVSCDVSLSVETTPITTTNSNTDPITNTSQMDHSVASATAAEASCAASLSEETAPTTITTDQIDQSSVTSIESPNLLMETTTSNTALRHQAPPTTTNENLDDKIDAAEGLLLLGTDVSSADDSQECPDSVEKTDIQDKQHRETLDVHHTDSEHNVPGKTASLPDETPEPVKSPKKGVLNFRQIGIKRHQPVDSSDPSAICSPPGSPANGDKQHNHKKRRKNSSVEQSTTTTTKRKKKKNKEKPTKSGKSPKSTTTTKTKQSKPTDTQRKNRPTETSEQRASTSRLPDETDDDKKYSIKRTVANGVTFYHCAYCSRKYDSLHGLNNHHENSHPPVICDVCNREFTTPNSLIHHSYTHYEQSFYCDQCNKSFPFKSQLETHQVVHTQTINFRCNKCGKGFVRVGEYNIHMKGHANIRLKCPEKGCDYDTVDVRNLNSHKKSHTKKISVFCKICGKGFVYHEQRKRHMKEHT